MSRRQSPPASRSLPFASLAAVAVASVLCWFAAGSARAAEDDGLAEARTHFESASRAYADGHYQTALDEYREAQSSHPTPAITFNMALTYERLGKKSLAIRFYRRYLDEQGDAPNAGEIKAHVKALQKASDDGGGEPDADAAPPFSPIARIVEASAPADDADDTAAADEAPPRREAAPARDTADAPDAADATDDSQPPPPPRRHHKKKQSLLLPGVMAGVAGGLLIGGAVSLTYAALRYNTLATTCAPTCATSDKTSVEVAAYVGYGLMGLGGAAAVVDVVLWVLATRHSDSNRAEAPAPRRWSIAPTLGGAVLKGSF